VASVVSLKTRNGKSAAELVGGLTDGRADRGVFINPGPDLFSMKLAGVESASLDADAI